MAKRAAIPSRSISPDPVAEGDALASASRWRAAVARWVDASKHSSPERRAAAERRLRWLIHESGASHGQHAWEEERRRNAYRVLLLALLCGAIATTLIILGIYTTEGTAPILAIGGWVGIVASMTCAILYVFRLSKSGHRRESAPLTADEIAAARELAEELDREVVASRPATSDRYD